MRISTTSNLSIYEKGGISVSQGAGEKLQSKMKFMEMYELELEDAKVNNPKKYQKMLDELDYIQSKPLSKIIEEIEQNGGSLTYRGIEMSYSVLDNQLKIGDMDEGRILSVGLSIGVNLKFNRENIDDIMQIWDLFSPADQRKILEALTIDNMVLEAELDLDDLKSGNVRSKSEETLEKKIQEESTKYTGTNTGEDISEDIINLLFVER